MNPPQQTAWQRWVRQPQRLWLRRALFQIHLWSGISLGLYIFFISVTGSVLVYRNELYVMALPEPLISAAVGPVLSNERLTEAALLAYPDYRVTRITRSSTPEQAVEIWLDWDDDEKKRLFDPRSGEDLGSAVAVGVMLVSTLIELHDDLLAGATGRKVNGIGAFAVLLVVLTGLVIWWPGVTRWRRSLTLHKGVGWRRFIWDLHSMVGFWSIGFVVVFSLSGIYLCFAESIHALADRIEPETAANSGRRFVDSFLYWLAFLHFGRINGIGLPCSGPGLCDQSVKAVWAFFGLAPAVMFVTGATMWWNRVLRRSAFVSSSRD